MSATKRPRPNAIDTKSFYPSPKEPISPSKRSPITPTSRYVAKSVKFWYPDGNVVIRVESTLFKLYRSRLAQYCRHFANIFEGQDNGASGTQIEGHPLYHAPEGLILEDFEQLLTALETPLTFSASPPTQSVAISLLRAAHMLSCNIILTLSKDRLCTIWDSRSPPRPHSSLALLLSSTDQLCPTARLSRPDPDSHPASAPPTYAEAVSIVLFARQYALPGVLKRAFYELLASPPFWAALVADRRQIRLHEDDLLRLYNARYVLQQAWRAAAPCVPDPDKKKGHASPACNAYFPGRTDALRAMVLGSGLVEPGAVDPLRYDLLAGLGEEERKKWCMWCLKDWEDALGEKRKVWWRMLDNLLPSQ
ncbi:hypothetical protein BD413DRAFT_617431 [Trametes elegans]|nr:hypothetical protein BD413DRAFT_617431 [Trametes elegans]